ncbi:TrpB-like pyridoxal phosphate-dependent enzyme [Paenibacillus sp. NPDC057934]|uniref:TrpB-like pyridoxal phosphate-dependent enzyme n=1 Tax=Paenibacillus sp. NPDC057934 TaxID=3346282 RepID=UPI0036DBA58E
MSTITKSLDIHLTADEMPRQWYNFMKDLPEALPPTLNHETEVCTSQLDISHKICPHALLQQDRWDSEWCDIPESVLENLIRIGRPTPLRRAYNLESYLGTPAKIYFKREDTLLTGSFKLNTAIAQAYYAKQEGFTGVVSETGAGQWGMALSLASSLYDLDCKIFMAKCSLEQKPYKRMYGAMFDCKFSASPGNDTEFGRTLLKSNPNHPGDIGTAISEAIEYALAHPDKAYLAGSNKPHVLMHQTLLGLEVRKQLEKVNDFPDELIACVSGGSNFGGLILPFLKDRLKNKNAIRFLAAESSAAPRLTQGTYDYDYSDYAGYTPKTMSYTMGHDFIPDPIHVGGLRQHNGSPIIGLLRNKGLVDAQAFNEVEAFKAARLFLNTEGVLVAPESAHAIASAISSAVQCQRTKTKKTIVVLCSGSGVMDLEGYQENLDQTSSFRII